MKKGQLQIQETILVLFIVVIIILLGLALFIRYQHSSILTERKAYDHALFQNMILTLPEDALIKCSRATQKDPCVDSLKLLAAAQNKKALEPLYGAKNITITQLYPIVQLTFCTPTAFTDCGAWQLYLNRPRTVTSTAKTVTPIALYRPEQDHYVIALLTIEAYNL